MIVDSWNKDMNHRGKLTCQEQLSGGVRGKKVDEERSSTQMPVRSCTRCIQKEGKRGSCAPPIHPFNCSKLICAYF